MENEKTKTRYQDWYEKNKVKAREQKKLVMRKLREKDPEKYNAQSRKAKVKERLLLFKMYGCKCAMCGYADMRALTLDHVLNNGSAERLELGERGVYRRAKQTYRPDEYQVLCMNCQFIKRHSILNYIDLNIEWLQQHGKY